MATTTSTPPRLLVAAQTVLLLLEGALLSPMASAADLTVSIVNLPPTISSVTVQVLKPDGSTNHISAAAMTFSSGSGLLATFTGSFNMNFYDDPATSTTTYKVKIVATDAAGASVNNVAALSTFNYAQLVALNLGSSALTLGSNLNPGAAGSIVTEAVQNYGNAQMDVQVSGTALSYNANTITVGSLAYSLNSDMSASSALTGSAATITTFDLAKGASSTKNLYVQLTAPAASSQHVPADAYTGTLTVAAVAG